MDQLLGAVLNGLTSGSIIFMFAAGLTVVFGVAGILNFAHGGVFMLAAYTAASILQRSSGSSISYLYAIIGAVAVAALLSVALEVLVIRRFYQYQHEYMLLGTYALLLVLEGSAEITFGVDAYFAPMPGWATNGFSVGAVFVNWYSVLVIVLGVAMAAGLVLWLRHTSSGKVIKAAAIEPEASRSLGINVPLVLTLVFALGGVFAGLAGVVLAPNQAIDLSLGSTFVVQAFAVVVVGGLGSISGAYVAALVLSLANSLWFTYLPGVPQVALYLVMVLILVFRPEGLFSVRKVTA
ncbi:MAG: amino acid/amide transporter rane protein 1, family [Marmoricola sp.]|nr:amino acid/amide transporter rane protein 1, family [Marmoricola sp.]